MIIEPIVEKQFFGIKNSVFGLLGKNIFINYLLGKEIERDEVKEKALRISLHVCLY